jgi:hypothetical protein
MSDNTNILHPDSVRQTLQSFWGESLEIAATRSGLSLAVPLCFPDGWQVLFDLQPLTPKAVRVTDRGRTLQWLAGAGQNIEADGLVTMLNEQIRTFQLQRDGWELYRELTLPLAGVDLHLFGEALVSIAHLNNLHEPASKPPNVARQTVEKVFKERKVKPERNFGLDGKVERDIRVDYYIEARHPVAMEVLGRRGVVRNYMEQWGFRWRDLRDAHPNLLPVMIYDPAVQEVDGLAQAIGESECELFCPYSETERIHAVLDKAGTKNIK